ncbi:MAG: hypothetical protein L6V95_02310 [Candidatus Melainabacteria bacterium]|nr:MAG: hypothetical protein L6V95_02310 [Candidatus Melainabacteria bacterium]
MIKNKNKTISSNAMTTPSISSQQVVSNIVAGQKAIDKQKNNKVLIKQHKFNNHKKQMKLLLIKIH